MRLRGRFQQCPARLRLAYREPDDDRHGALDGTTVVQSRHRGLARVNQSLQGKVRSRRTARMVAAFWKLVALCALLLMPFGMSAAQAAPATANHDKMMGKCEGSTAPAQPDGQL